MPLYIYTSARGVNRKKTGEDAGLDENRKLQKDKDERRECVFNTSRRDEK